MTFEDQRCIGIEIEGETYTCVYKVYEGNNGKLDKTILFIQGLADTYMHYHHILEPLSKIASIVTLDLPGFGLSQQNIFFSYNKENIMNIMSQFIDSINIKSEFHLIGVSIGANIALMISRMYEGILKIKTITLITPVFSRSLNLQLRWLSLPWNRYLLKFMMKPNMAKRKKIQSLYFRMVLSNIFSITEEQRGLYLLMFGNEQVAKPYHSILSNFVSIFGLKSSVYYEIWELLENIVTKSDISLIIAEHDKIVNNKEIIENLNKKGFDNICTIKSGHSIHIEKQDELLKVLQTQIT